MLHRLPRRGLCACCLSILNTIEICLGKCVLGVVGLGNGGSEIGAWPGAIHTMAMYGAHGAVHVTTDRSGERTTVLRYRPSKVLSNGLANVKPRCGSVRPKDTKHNKLGITSKSEESW
jgi:hypothetical protein